MSFDKIFDLTAGVYLIFYNIGQQLELWFIVNQPFSLARQRVEEKWSLPKTWLKSCDFGRANHEDDAVLMIGMYWRFILAGMYLVPGVGFG